LAPDIPEQGKTLDIALDLAERSRGFHADRRVLSRLARSRGTRRGAIAEAI